MRKSTFAVLASLVIWLTACAGGGDSSSGGQSGGTPTGVGPATQIIVTQQPAGAAAATAFTQQPRVELRNAASQLVASDSTTQVTVAITAASGTAGAVLSGTNTLTASAGVVTFSGLSIDLAGSNYSLTFTATGLSNGVSASFSVSSSGGGGPITPDTPPASAVNFTINTGQNVHAISRWIYGMNGVNWGSRPANLTLSRSGGNRLTCYNWENNASNAGTDWYNENDWAMGLPTDPVGYAATSMIDGDRTNNAASLITVPVAGYVAADHGHLGGAWPQYDVNQTANYLSVRFKQNVAKKGGAFTTTPSTSDDYVYQDEFVSFIKGKYPGGASDPNKPIFYSLDNEPDLWGGTHPRIRGDATGSNGQGPTYAEMLTRTKDFADAIKDVDANAIVFGPVNYGWLGMVNLQNVSDAGGFGDFHTYYLQQLAAAETTYGHRLVDVLDVHWYPEATGGGVRITGDGTSAALVAARLQAPRSLWDPTYTETSWITSSGSSGGPIQLFPRMQAKINAHYPGTKIAVTEYYYGGGDHISGGIAQADVLGIFARENIFAATLWKLGSTQHSFIYGGFEMFRNFDGANGSFGDTSVRADNTNVADASVYASVDAANPSRMVLVCINKTASAQTAGIQVTHTVRFNTAEIYVLTSASSTPVKLADVPITLVNAFQYSMPAYSVTTIVLKP